MGDNSIYKQNMTTAENDGYVPSSPESVVTIPIFKGGTRKNTDQSDAPQSTPMLSLLLHTQTNNCKDCRDSTTPNFSLTESELIKIEKHRLLHEKESTMNYQYKLLLTQNSIPVEDAQNENGCGSGQNIGFYYTLKDAVTESFDVNYINETCVPQKKQWEHPIGCPWNTDIYRHLGNQQISGAEVPESPSALDHQDSKSTTALLAISPVLQLPPATTLTLLPTNRLAISRLSDIKDASDWYVDGDKLRMKEKLTRRQLIQITAMMALGFVFVALIVVWVFSPILF